MSRENGSGRRTSRRVQGRRRVVFFAIALLALAASTQALGVSGGFVGPGLDNTDWITIGHDPSGTRSQPNEQTINAGNVDALVPKWIAPTSGDVSGTPAVSNSVAYFGDFGGTLWAVDAATGNTKWSDSIAAITGAPGDFARQSPSVDGNVLIVGTNKGGNLVGVDTSTGKKLWEATVNPDPHATMTGSPVLAGDTVFTGVSANGASGPNATFRTDLASVNALTGKVNWTSYVLPDNGGNPGGYAGATMFGSPSVDVPDGLVIGSFGQPYTEPASVTACNKSAPNGFFSEACEQPGADWDSIVAFNIDTGAIVWSHRVVGDAPRDSVCNGLPAQVTWCFPATDTPLAAAEGKGSGFGDVWDLGGAPPNVFQLGGRTVVGAAEKSGVYILLDAKTGQLIWNTLVGPGGDQGGFEWGTAYDGNRIYVSLTDQHHIPYDLTENGQLTNTVATGGSWAALDPATGEILWQVADPQTESPPGFNNVGVWDLAPVSVANGVVYAASMAKSGNEMYGLDAATGKILWSFSAGASVNAAPSIVGDSVYWGCGYSRSGVEGSGCTKLFAFTLRPPGNVSCVNQVLTGLVQGNLTVPAGAWCDLTNNVHVTGNLQLQGSTGVRIEGAEIDGNLQANGTSRTADPSSPGINVICGTTVKGNLQVWQSSASAPWTIGDGAGCAGNTISHNLQVQENAAAMTVSNNTVGGNLQFLNNTSNTNTVAGNTSNGNLLCQGNGAVSGSGNHAHGNVQGQCTGTRF
jgi:polyvinyl alcohol dehydrogenase (cytochrome)